MANGPGAPVATMTPALPVSDAKLNDLLSYYHTVQDLIKAYATKANRIDSAILILSVVTSGALWLLASQVVPQVTAWVGAIISTVVTGLTIYLYASGLNRRRKTAHELYTDIGKFIAQYRATPGMSESDYWNAVKGFESAIEDLKFGRD
jgi:hypothetical protein